MPLYASVGAELIQFDLDVATAALTRRGTVTVPANVQYVWPHAARRFLYVASSDSASGMGQAGTKHHVSAFRIDPATGALDPHGQPIPLPYRPIHMSTDIPSNHVLVAFNNPPDVRVYRINADATLGAEVSQPPDIDPGVFPHQVLAMPDNRHVILVARGHDAAGGKPEEPGALKVFRHDNGVLRDEVSIAPSHQTLDLCVVGAAERARDVHARCGPACRDPGVPGERTDGTRQHPRSSIGWHGARASKRALRLCREPRQQYRRQRWQKGIRRWREHDRGLRH